MSARKQSSMSALLACAECGAEAQLLDVDEYEEAIAEWTAQHEACGQPESLTNWQHLVDRGDKAVLIEHVGNAQKVLPFPRPTWADPDRDQISEGGAWTCYRSAIASVPATTMMGRSTDDGDSLLTQRVNVSASQYRLMPAVSLSICKMETSASLTLTLDETRQLAEVLVAAADMAVMP